MSKNKTEDTVKKRVREETELIERSDAPGAQTGEAGEARGFRDLFEDMWSDLEDHEDSK